MKLPRVALLERIASGASVAGTLDELVLHVEALLPGAIGSILLLEGGRLRGTSVVRLPDTYNAAVEGIEIGPDKASCGAAAWRCEPVYVSDIASDPLWADFRDVALSHGLRACWSVPIRSRREPERQRVLGTFAVYFREPHVIDAHGESVLSQAEKLACIAIEADAAARALHEEQARFRTFVDHSLDGYFLHDGETGHIVDANRQACESLGYTHEELVGMLPYDIDPDVTAASLGELFLRIAEGESIAFESRHRRKDGTTFPVEIRIKRISSLGRPVNLALARDLTAQRRLEEQLHHARRMEAIGRLAGGIAHDFNNLLTVVEVSSELLLARIPEGSPLRDDVIATRDAGARAAALTAQLLAFSRQSIIAPRPLDLNALVERLAAMLDRVIGENVQLSTRLAPSLPHIVADPGQVEQVLMNLVVNARDAMPRGGEVVIRTGVVPPAADDLGTMPIGPAPTVALTVTDAGEGMTPEVQQRLFEPYFTTKGPGRGLGLATVYGIVKQSGGAVVVESRPGEGSSISVRFVEAVVAPPPAPPEPGPPRGGQEVVLLVEDEAEVRRLVARALASSGYVVHQARSAEEALALERSLRGPLHLVVTDVVMPVCGGRELADALRERRSDLRVLFISGYTDDGIVRDGLSGIGDAFLQKPFTPAALARKVREILDAPAG